ncbi:MAG: metallophosphoesterase [Phycisphaerales bacterium]|nr:MAG: metallophosphoesterase [Phycisphaerales bacterium]
MSVAETTRVLIFFAFLAAVCLAEVSLVVAFTLDRLNKKKTNILIGPPAILVHALTAAIIACVLWGYFVEPYRLEVNIIPVRTDKLTGVTFRIVQISDLHCDRKIRNEKRLVEVINALEADIIVFTGDALNSIRAEPTFKKTLTDLKASVAKLAVRGNCDLGHWAHLDLFFGTGFQLVEGKTVSLTKGGESVSITGLACLHMSPFRGLLEKVPPDQVSVLLCHFSDLVESLGGLNVDFYLSGHTHGGQVALPIYGALVTLAKYGKKYESGLYTVGRTKLYVNRGVGMEGGFAPRVRFLARPEVAVFDIGPAK